jgi:hypothetical protein
MQTHSSAVTSQLEPPSQRFKLSRMCIHRAHLSMKGPHVLGVQHVDAGAKSIESTSTNSSMGDHPAPQSGRIYASHLLTWIRASYLLHQRVCWPAPLFCRAPLTVQVTSILLKLLTTRTMTILSTSMSPLMACEPACGKHEQPSLFTLHRSVFRSLSIHPFAPHISPWSTRQWRISV